MTPNPNENQAEKHSAEPWSVGLVRCNMIFDAENNMIAELRAILERIEKEKPSPN